MREREVEEGMLNNVQSSLAPVLSQTRRAKGGGACCWPSEHL